MPAFLSGRAAYRPADLLTPVLLTLLLAGLVSGLAAVAWTWPAVDGFWRREVWWESESVRESMGLMFGLVALAVAAFSASRYRRNNAH